ncbi:MAG: hypothetical protein M9915_01515 [Rhizobacter sp.]|nr:hypothetical protein [Rhizobacter sp.]
MTASEARPDVARIRLDNALALFDEFVRATIKHPDAATLRGLEGRFAERLQIQPSYWSQIKSRARQIGERLARQFEVLCHKPHGWMDEAHDASDTPRAGPGSAPTAVPAGRGRVGSATAAPPGHAGAPDGGLIGELDDDERFIVGLVLTYYRRHPQRARAKLLELLGEVLTPATTEPSTIVQRPRSAQDEKTLWERTRQGVAPLKHKG